jgi:hypothetical protein
MARMSIYVPDALKAEMDEIGDNGVNWSGEAQRVFEAAIQRVKWPKEPKMEDVIARLRASKDTEDQNDNLAGLAAGREWAMKHATHRELKKLATMDLLDSNHQEDEAWLVVDRALGTGEDGPDSSFWFEPADDRFGFTPPSDTYVEGYLAGASEVWEAVSTKV